MPDVSTGTNTLVQRKAKPGGAKAVRGLVSAGEGTNTGEEPLLLWGAQAGCCWSSNRPEGSRKLKLGGSRYYLNPPQLSEDTEQLVVGQPWPLNGVQGCTKGHSTSGSQLRVGT